MKNLKIARKAKKLTQVQMAKLLFLSETAYVNYETGKSDPPLSTLIKLSNILGVSTDFLLGLEEKPTEKEIEITNFIRKLKTELEVLDPKKKEGNK